MQSMTTQQYTETTIITIVCIAILGISSVNQVPDLLLFLEPDSQHPVYNVTQQ